MARLVPIHKKGPRDLIKNYRPISILPAISKTMEKYCTNTYIIIIMIIMIFSQDTNITEVFFSWVLQL